MIRAVLADSGPLYAAADPDDAHHRRAQNEQQRLEEERKLVLGIYPTLLEAHTLVLYRLGEESASNWLKDVLGGIQFINPEATDYRRATETLGRFNDQSISLFDATLAAVASRLGVEVWTYDHHFDIMGTPVWR